MKLAELFPTLAAAALRLRHEGDAAKAEGLEMLVLKLGDYGASEVEDLPLKAPKKAKLGSARKRTVKPPATGQAEVLAGLEALYANAGDAVLTLEDIRSRVAALCQAASLPVLRKAGKAFLHLPLSGKSKRDIEDLLYGHMARRKDRTSW